MSDTGTLLRSFAGGEITPEMFGRLDLPKFQTALALCKNFVVLPYGAAENRAGGLLVNQAKFSTKKARLIPFAFNTTQTFAMEFGENYIRFHTNGATLTEAPLSIVAMTPGVDTALQVTAHGFTSGQTAFVAGTPTSPAINGRFVQVVTIDANHFFVRTLGAGAGIVTTGTTLTAGATVSRVYEVATSYLESELFDIHYVQSADVVTLTHPAHDPLELRRLSATNWTLSSISFVPQATAPATPTLLFAGTASPRFNYQYVVTALGPTGEESLPSPLGVNFPQGRVLGAMTNANPGVFTSTTATVFTPGDPVLFDATIVGPVSLRNTMWVVDSCPTATTFTLRDPITGIPLDTTALPAYSSGGVVFAQAVTNDLNQLGASNVIQWVAAAGATGYRVYKFSAGAFGFIGQTTTATVFNDNNIIADTSRTPPQTPTNIPTGTGNQPRGVGYFEQRRAFGGADNSPQSVVMTRPGTESNLSKSFPTRDDDAISFKFAARDVNVVRHIIPLQDLLLLTSGSALRVVSQNSDALTPSTISIRVQGYDGASMVQPIVTNSSILFGSSRGGRVREIAYSLEAQGYRSDDISIFAPHLVDGFTITDMAYARAPNQLGWFVRSDGVLLGLTYVPDQQILGWHQHATQGTYESVCVIGEGNEDVLYQMVNRTIGGAPVRFIERVATRRIADPREAHFVDCGLVFDGRNFTGNVTMTITTLGADYSTASLLAVTSNVASFTALDVGRTMVVDVVDATGAVVDQSRVLIGAFVSPTVVTGKGDKLVPPLIQNVATTAWERAVASLTGLWHLEGQTVSILGDGAVFPTAVVTNGTIALDQPAAVVHAGLGYVSDMQTLPIILQQAMEDGQGAQKNIDRISLRVFKSSGIFAGPDFNNLAEYAQRTTEPFGTPPLLTSSIADITLFPAWTDDGQVCVRQVDPLPLSVLSMAIELAVGG